MALMPNTCKTSINQPLEALYTRVKANLMWNVQLKTLDYFSCVHAYDLGYLGPISPNIPRPDYLRNRYSSTHRGSWHQSKVSFDVKPGAEDVGLLFMCPCTWFGVFGPSFPKLSQYLSTCETGIIGPTEGLDTSIRSHLMWNKELKTLDFFLCDSVLDLGVFGPFSPKFL